MDRVPAYASIHEAVDLAKDERRQLLGEKNQRHTPGISAGTAAD